MELQRKLRELKNPSYLQSSTTMLLFFASWGIWWSFFQLWLTSEHNGLGLSGSAVGTIFSINSIASLVLMFLYGTIQDKLFIKRHLLIFNAILATLIAPFFIFVYAPLLQSHFIVGAWIGAIFLSAAYHSAVGVLEATTGLGLIWICDLSLTCRLSLCQRPSAKLHRRFTYRDLLTVRSLILAPQRRTGCFKSDR